MEPTDETRDRGDAVAAEADEAAPPKKKKGGLIMIVLFAVALIGGGAGGFFMYDKLVAMATGTDLSVLEPQTETVEYGAFHEMQGLIVNPAASGGKRYLMVSMALEVANDGVVEQLKEKEIVVHDGTLQILGRHTAEELADISVREQLKEELLAAVNEVVGEGQVSRLYFTQYVLQ